MNSSAENRNWLVVGEMIRLVQKPVSIYVDEIVRKFHKKLCQDFVKNTSCPRSDCKKMTLSCGLCSSCQTWWRKKLQKAHKKGHNLYANCDGKKWYYDHWEVAKFFMPALGNNQSTVINAKSTELSSLLNVLEWIDIAFLRKSPVNLDLVRKLRSEVRNTWAHAPNHELSDHQKEDYFKIAANFLEDLKKVFPSEITEIKRAEESIENLKTNGVTNLSSCLPEKLLNFTGRENEIEEFIKFLQEKKMDIISLCGGPGFGKSALAVEVSHRLCDDHNMVVIFCDLSTASTIEEVNLRLCRDISINPEEDPKSSLSLWLKNLNKAVVLLLDDVDNLLQTSRSKFDDFIRSLRKNSNQKLKIITTSRTSYTIQGLLFKKIKIEEMNEQSSMALLKSACLYQNDEFLQRLAGVCGYIPLAMCIAASLVHNYHDAEEILKHLEVHPMTALKNSESNQFVYGAFNASYKYLSVEQKDTLLRLTIFEGDFSENAAKAVLDGDDIQQKTLLTDLVNRSLLKKSGTTEIRHHRYSIHLLIRCFLIEQSGSEEKRAKSEKLMVAYFLDLCAKSTVQSYSHDKFVENSEILKREAHNIENVLTICSDVNNIEISSVLCDNEIYKSSCRFFYNIVRTVISETVIGNFVKACADLAQAREEWTNKINFGCILVDQEGRKSFWNSDAYFRKMKATEEEFQKYEECLTKDVALQGYFFYQLGRRSLNQYRDYKDNDDSEIVKYMDTLRSEANKHLCKSWELRKSLPVSPLAKADVILSLIQLGNLWKKISSRQYGQYAKEDGEKSFKQAEKYYKEAKEKAQNDLGKHELTSACYKSLGDLFLQSRQNKAAMEYYNDARYIRERLNLNTSEEYVLLLNNIGRCLFFLERYTDAIEMLEKARNIAEKLTEDDQATHGKGKVYTSLAMTYDKSKTYPEKAKEFAERALEINWEMNNKIIKGKEVKILQRIRKCQLKPACIPDFKLRSGMIFLFLIIALVLVIFAISLAAWRGRIFR